MNQANHAQKRALPYPAEAIIDTEEIWHDEQENSVPAQLWSEVSNHSVRNQREAQYR
jgi:hypothetical protein